ncbi:DUF3006 domain-containing protein [Virgibacillus halophilus]|uniref:DUF3006 domain-containing protein n=1 Tax=Tigheibacillus halophilus TaxID=361280 RepID=UPI00363712FB
MRYTIDQLEEKLAVCEDDDGNTVNISKSKLPKKAKVGDVLQLSDGRYTIDKKTTKQRREEIEALMDEIWDD